MSTKAIYIEGELYLSFEVVAEVYRVQVAWLHEACEVGLFGSGHSPAGPCIAAVQLDRVSTIVRLHHGLGLDLEAISLTLEDRSA